MPVCRQTSFLLELSFVKVGLDVRTDGQPTQVKQKLEINYCSPS